MRVNIWYKSCLFLIGLLIIFFTFFFKLKTGSFLKIGDEALKEVVKYIIHVRRFDITTTSLSKSCVDINLLINQIKTEFKELENDSCANFFADKIEFLPPDSSLVMVMYIIHDNSVLVKREFSQAGYTNLILLENQSLCRDTLKINLVIDDNVTMISEIENFPQFVECICKQP